MGPSENPTRIESEDRSCLRLRSGSFDFVFSLFLSFALFALSKARHHDAPTTPTTNVCLRRLIDVTSLREIKFVDDNTLLAFPFSPLSLSLLSLPRVRFLFHRIYSRSCYFFFPSFSLSLCSIFVRLLFFVSTNLASAYVRKERHAIYPFLRYFSRVVK